MTERHGLARCKRPLEAIEREILGCCFFACHDHRLRPDHFRHEGRRIAFACHEVLRQQGYVMHADDSDAGVSQILAAELNAEFLSHQLEQLNLWPSLSSARHELLVECLQPIGDWHLDHFQHSVARLIFESKRRDHIERLTAELEAVERGMEVAA